MKLNESTIIPQPGNPARKKKLTEQKQDIHAFDDSATAVSRQHGLPTCGVSLHRRNTTILPTPEFEAPSQKHFLNNTMAAQISGPKHIRNSPITKISTRSQERFETERNNKRQISVLVGPHASSNSSRLNGSEAGLCKAWSNKWIGGASPLVAFLVFWPGWPMNTCFQGKKSASSLSAMNSELKQSNPPSQSPAYKLRHPTSKKRVKRLGSSLHHSISCNHSIPNKLLRHLWWFVIFLLFSRQRKALLLEKRY